MAAWAISIQHNPSDRLGAVRFHGLLDREHAEVIEFYATRQDADRELARSFMTGPAGQDGSRSCSWTSVVVSRP